MAVIVARSHRDSTAVHVGIRPGNMDAFPEPFDAVSIVWFRRRAALPSMPPTPTLVAMGDTASQLETAIGMGILRITDQAVLDALGYVVPPGGSNCGQGDAQDAFTAVNDGSVATDVAEGYSALLPKFMVVYGDPGDAADTGTAGALQQARAALKSAEADDTTAAFRLRTLREAVTEAQTADTAARAVFNAISPGPGP